jgi:hypothetical protein
MEAHYAVRAFNFKHKHPLFFPFAFPLVVASNITHQEDVLKNEEKEMRER